MEEQKKKEILWWQHFFNFLFCIAAGYALMLLLISYFGFAFLGLEIILFLSYLKQKRKQDMLIQVLVLLTGLLIGYSLCIGNIPVLLN